MGAWPGHPTRSLSVGVWEESSAFPSLGAVRPGLRQHGGEGALAETCRPEAAPAGQLHAVLSQAGGQEAGGHCLGLPGPGGLQQGRPASYIIQSSSG